MRPHRCTCGVSAGTSPRSFCTSPRGCSAVGALRAARRVCSTSGAPSCCPSGGLSAVFPLALGHLLAFSSALPLACPCYGPLLAALAAQHRLRHPPPSQKHGGCFPAPSLAPLWPGASQAAGHQSPSPEQRAQASRGTPCPSSGLPLRLKRGAGGRERKRLPPGDP